MATLLLKKLYNRIPFEVTFKDGVFILLGVEQDVEYVDGKRTDNVIGTKYEVVDTLGFEKIKVKVKGQLEPIISNEELQTMRDSGKKVAVEFINGIDTLYLRTVNKGTSNEKQTVEDSFSADDVKLVEYT